MCLPLELQFKRNNRPLEAIERYWSQLSWLVHLANANNSATWLELYLDFVAATGVSVVGSSQSPSASIKMAEGRLVP